MSWRRALLTAAALLAFVYGAAYTDLVLRARSAYLEGEKWMEWSRKPELKKAHFDAILAAREKDLTKEREAGRLAPAAFTQKMGLARFERDEAAVRLAALTPQEGYAQFLSFYLLFGVRVPDDLIPLAEADFRDRVAIVIRRQEAFAALARAAAARKGIASP